MLTHLGWNVLVCMCVCGPPSKQQYVPATAAKRFSAVPKDIDVFRPLQTFPLVAWSAFFVKSICTNVIVILYNKEVKINVFKCTIIVFWNYNPVLCLKHFKLNVPVCLMRCFSTIFSVTSGILYSFCTFYNHYQTTESCTFCQKLFINLLFQQKNAFRQKRIMRTTELMCYISVWFILMLDLNKFDWGFFFFYNSIINILFNLFNLRWHLKPHVYLCNQPCPKLILSSYGSTRLHSIHTVQSILFVWAEKPRLVYTYVY